MVSLPQVADVRTGRQPTLTGLDAPVKQKLACHQTCSHDHPGTEAGEQSDADALAAEKARAQAVDPPGNDATLVVEIASPRASLVVVDPVASPRASLVAGQPAANPFSPRVSPLSSPTLPRD